MLVAVTVKGSQYYTTDSVPKKQDLNGKHNLGKAADSAALKLKVTASSIDKPMGAKPDVSTKSKV